MPKRLFDLAVAVPLLILISPLLLAIAVVVRLDSPGPATYRRRHDLVADEVQHLMIVRAASGWPAGCSLNPGTPTWVAAALV
jgi:hypothetical protein